MAVRDINAGNLSGKEFYCCKALLLCLIAMVLSSCSSIGGKRCDESASTLRAEAYQMWKQGWNQLALSKAKQSIEIARHAGKVSTDLIEGYDDAGLYYFELGDYENSARFQAVAVLLSLSLSNDRESDNNSASDDNNESDTTSEPENKGALRNSNEVIKNSAMYNVYLQRLRWALGKYKPTIEFSTIEQNPNSLLCTHTLNLQNNPDIRQVFYYQYRHPKLFKNRLLLRSAICNT